MRDGIVKHSITQRIGLDPLSPKIKSWSFDSDGGLAEAYWDKIGDSWVVSTRGASPNGHITSAHNVYTDIGPDAFTVESSEARAGNSSLKGFKLKFTRDMSSETPAASGNPPGGNSPPGSGNPPTQPSPGVDSMAKERILNSAEWRQTQQAYYEWLSVQKIYTPQEVKRLRADTQAKVAKMSAAQLQSFLDDANEKVKILLSKDAEDARLWLAQRMAVEVKLTPEQMKEERPDIANMTSAQVEQRLLQIDQERKQTKTAQESFVRRPQVPHQGHERASQARRKRARAA